MKTKPDDDAKGRSRPSSSEDDCELIPPYEWGPGCRLDIATNTLYGASGRVFRDVQIDAESLKKAFEKKGI